MNLDSENKMREYTIKTNMMKCSCVLCVEAIRQL